MRDALENGETSPGYVDENQPSLVCCGAMENRGEQRDEAYRVA